MASFLNTLGGPLFAVQWRGVLCPCLEKADDRKARKALAFLQHYHVSWLKGGGERAAGILSGWLGGGSKNSPANADSTTAELVFVDAASGHPQLQVQPLPDESDEQPGGIRLSKSGGYIKTISLKDCVKVVATSDTLVLQGNPPNTTKGAAPKDLLRFQLLSQDDVQEVQGALQEIISWEARRLDAIPEDEREVDVEHGLQARAQKAAHFAKREIEMKQQRRQREERKAKYVKEAGGLKYTALAMANREAELS